jgi:beta-lactamase regulating signal transducer with metallopeptidase domain
VFGVLALTMLVLAMMVIGVMALVWWMAEMALGALVLAMVCMSARQAAGKKQKSVRRAMTGKKPATTRSEAKKKQKSLRRATTGKKPVIARSEAKRSGWLVHGFVTLWFVTLLLVFYMSVW